MSKVQANADPGRLLREQLRRDGAGELTSSQPWIDTSVDCPGHLPGPDAYTLIASYAIGRIAVYGDSASALVTFKRLGTVWSDSTFKPDTATTLQTVVLVHTKYGWRIRVASYPWLNVLLSASINLRHGDRVVAARLARSMAPNKPLLLTNAEVFGSGRCAAAFY